MKNKSKKNLIAKLRPFWKEYWELEGDFNDKVIELERRMNQNSGEKIKLEFFKVEGECCGIGAKDYSKREKFPLIRDTELS